MKYACIDIYISSTSKFMKIQSFVMFKAIWSYPVAGQEAICSAFKASSAICDETQDVRTAGAHQGPARPACGGMCMYLPPAWARAARDGAEEGEGERRKVWRGFKASEGGQQWEAVTPCTALW